VSKHVSSRHSSSSTAQSETPGEESTSRLRRLPSVESVAQALSELGGIPHTAAVRAARVSLAEMRRAIRDGTTAGSDLVVARAMAVAEEQRRFQLRPVINATGVIISTNLGRAPLSAAAIDQVAAVARGYSNLEFDLEAGGRGSRQAPVRELLRELTGAEDVLVVNNNAAALLLALAVVAAEREVVISRGELVEIGGGFRIPDVMRQSGARLVEVGTTNRTRQADFDAALCDATAAFLVVHPSNFKMIGFTESPALEGLARLAHTHGIVLVHDVGSGCLLNTERWGLAHEPTPQESIEAGADIVCFSGDKLLGGPQAGIIIGKKALLRQIERHPLMRAMRIDKLTLAALEATLALYRDGLAERDLPIWRAIAAPVEDLRRRAEHWAEALSGWGCSAASAVSGVSTVGGGSLPGETLPTVVCAVELAGSAADRWAERLRGGSPSVVARIARDRVLLDPRTVLPEEDEMLLAALQRALPATT
jgi:L-seryl-tRNA(Ser) seleniumtransferase